MHRSINSASIDLLQKHPSVRLSLMPASHFFQDAVDRLKACGATGCGVHLTLNSEFPKLPTSPLSQGRSLREPNGFFWPSVSLSRKFCEVAEVYRECESQIERVLNCGLKITHLDSHMFFTDAEVWGNVELEEMIAGWARTLKVPFRRLAAGNTRFIWESHLDGPSRFAYYDALLSDPPDAETELILHPATDEESIQYFTTSGPRRVADYLYFANSRLEAVWPK